MIQVADVHIAHESSQAAELLSEFKRIRKGRGIADSARQGAVGPRLTELCMLTGRDSPEVVVSKVAHVVSSLLQDLTADEAAAVSAALGIGADFGGTHLLGERIEQLAARLGVDQRTARRRIDQALATLADCVARDDDSRNLASSARRGWHVRSVRAVVLLGGGGVEVLEFRTIVSDVVDLRKIDLGISIPSPRDGLDLPQIQLVIDSLYGGEIAKRHIETSARTAFVLEFPRALKLGEAYEYGIRFRLPPNVEMLPYYVLLPFVACDEFDLRAKFETPPVKVELLSGVLQADASDSVLGAPSIEIDTLGEVHAKFRQLQPGLAYGVRWQKN